MNDGSSQFEAGAAVRPITPSGPCLLSGYPRGPRVSTGVHDELLCSALYLSSGGSGVLILSVDLNLVSRELVGRVRERIAAATGIAAATIAIAATHTHSGPVIGRRRGDWDDWVEPEPDQGYLELLAGRMVEAGCEAIRSARAAQVGLTSFPVGGIGSHHQNPLGPADWEATLLVARDAATRLPIGSFFIYAMHPTVLGGDATQVSGDFPHFFREFLWDVGTFPRSAPILFLNGASGDQSPRFLVRANTFAEAQRLGDRLGRFAQAAALGISFFSDGAVEVRSVAMGVDGSPAGIQVLRIGVWNIVFWPGEFLVESGLELKARCARTWLVTLANGELPACLATEAEASAGLGETGHTVAASRDKQRFIEATMALLRPRNPRCAP